MFLVKVTAETIDQVVTQSKYASSGIPKQAKMGDIMLIALSNIGKGEKSIRYIMNYDGFYEDHLGESQQLWGKQWRYIIKGTNIQPVEPFNMEDVQTREKPYVFNMGNYLYVASEDETAVLHWILSEEQMPQFIYPDELPDESKEHREGKKKTVTVNVYERNPDARRACIYRYGAKCFICEFDFGREYGEKCEGMIHVHHLKMVSKADKEYIVDPIEDLRPVCPNCHMVLHSKKDGCYSISEVKAMLRV